MLLVWLWIDAVVLNSFSLCHFPETNAIWKTPQELFHFFLVSFWSLINLYFYLLLGVMWHLLETFSWPHVVSKQSSSSPLPLPHHSRPLTCRMTALIEAQGPKCGSSAQTQNFLDLEGSAAPHLHHSEPDGSTQCDVAPRPAGIPPTVCVFASGPVEWNCDEPWSTAWKSSILFFFIYLLRLTLLTRSWISDIHCHSWTLRITWSSLPIKGMYVLFCRDRLSFSLLIQIQNNLIRLSIRWVFGVLAW